MAKVKINGLANAKPNVRPKPLVPGQYEVTFDSAPSEEERDDGYNFGLRMTVVDGPEQPEYDGDGVPTGDTVPPDGRILPENLFVMKPSHPQYDDYGHIGVGDLKSILLCFDVPVGPDDTFDVEDFVGQTGVVKVAVRRPSKKDKEAGRDEPYNVVKKWVPAG